MPLTTFILARAFADSVDLSRTGPPPKIEGRIKGEIYLEIDQAKRLREYVKAGGRPLLEIVRVGYIAGD